MDAKQRCTLEEIARALWAYTKEAEKNPEFSKRLERVAVPGGKSVREFAHAATRLSTAFPADYDQLDAA